MPAIVTLIELAALPHPRIGERPRMRKVLPHFQLDQAPASSVMREFLDRCMAIPSVSSKQSRMASPATHALYLSDERAAGPPEAFIDGHEFCHIHPLPESSIQLTLPRFLGDEVFRLGWGEPHPITILGTWTCLYTIYAPRDSHEIEVVYGLVLQSLRFARGTLMRHACAGDPFPVEHQ